MNYEEIWGKFSKEGCIVRRIEMEFENFYENLILKYRAFLTVFQVN